MSYFFWCSLWRRWQLPKGLLWKYGPKLYPRNPDQLRHLATLLVNVVDNLPDCLLGPGTAGLGPGHQPDVVLSHLNRKFTLVSDSSVVLLVVHITHPPTNALVIGKKVIFSIGGIC